MQLNGFIIILLCCYKPSAGSILNITRNNFSELVERSPDPWLVHFCSRLTKECKNALSEFLKASNILDRYIRLGFVDVDEEVHLNYRFGVSTVPKIFLFGFDKMVPRDFEGFRTVRGFTTAALKLVEEDVNEQIKSRFVRSKTVRELDEYSLKKLLSGNKEHKRWCAVNYSSNCRDCSKFSDIFKRLSEHFKHSFNFGAIDVLKHSHDLEKYPQVRHYISEDTTNTYSGELTYVAVKNWLTGILPDPTVVQLTRRKVLDSTCQHKQYCVFVSIPSLDEFNSTYRANFIEDLRQKALGSKHLSLGWLWFEVGEQIHLERLLNIAQRSSDENLFPIYTAVHVKKLIYLQMRQYNKDSSEVLDKLLGHVMDESDFDEIIDAREFPKVFKVTPWVEKKSEERPVKSEL